MKMIKCKRCGKIYPNNLKYCPECTANTPLSANGCLIAILAPIIVFIAVLIIGSIIIDTTDTSTSPSSSITNVDSNSNNSSKPKNSKNESKVIYSDSDIKITYNKIADGKDLGVTACYIYLKVENLSSQTFNVSLIDAYANDTAVTVMTGVPVKIAPGKNSQQPFLFGYNEIFKSADEVEKLEFKVCLYNTEYSEIIKTTKSIKIDIK